MPNTEVFQQTQVGACVAHLDTHFLLTSKGHDFCKTKSFRFYKMCYTLLQLDTFHVSLLCKAIVLRVD